MAKNLFTKDELVKDFQKNYASKNIPQRERVSSVFTYFRHKVHFTLISKVGDGSRFPETRGQLPVSLFPST